MAIFRKKTDDDVPRRRKTSDETRESAQPRLDQQTFRRNRTLTGSTSNSVSSSAHMQPDMQSHRSHVHHLSRIRRRMGSYLLIIIVGIITVYWLLTQLTAQVKIVFYDTTISNVQNTTIYQKAINDYLSINPLSRLRFLLDVNDLSKYMSTVVAEVDSVSDVSRGAIGETNFSLVMRRPVAGWKIGDKQYYVDAKGVAFERNYFVSPTVQIVDESGATLEQGALIASNQFLGFVGRVVSLSKVKGYIVTDAILPAGTTRQLEIKLSGVTPLIKLSIDRPAGEQVEDMARSLVYLTGRGQTPAYIDVRVSGKAFYK
jgi:hypothetical protein